MAQQHPRAGIPHDLAYMRTMLWIVAMNRAALACRLVYAVWACSGLLLGIFQKLGALAAKRLLGMLPAAIQMKHLL